MLVHNDLEGARWVQTCESLRTSEKNYHSFHLTHYSRHVLIFHALTFCATIVLQRESFQRAMISSPHDKRITSNFNTLLQDDVYMGGNNSAYEEYLRMVDKK